MVVFGALLIFRPELFSAKTSSPSLETPLSSTIETQTDGVVLESEVDSVSEEAQVEVFINLIDGAEVVFIPAGIYTIGSEDGEDDENPVHDVVLDEFYMYKYEVSAAQYLDFLDQFEVNEILDEGWMWARGNAYYDYYPTIEMLDGGFQLFDPDINLPATGISWEGANQYCSWVGGRLPTEAEWEAAAHGQTDNLYPWGNEDPTCDRAFFNTCRPPSSQYPDEIGNRPDGASPFGVEDMVGNVSEFVYDWYDAEFYSISPEINPVGPDESTYVNVVRGGNLIASSWNLRVSDRSSATYGTHHEYIGFRCMLPEDPTPNQSASEEADTITNPIDDAAIVLIPAGTYTIGSGGEEDEKPVHDVVLDEYSMYKYEVTASQFADFVNQAEPGVVLLEWVGVGITTHNLRITNETIRPVQGRSDHPANGISREGADAYCQWAVEACPLKLMGSSRPWEH